MTKIYVDVEQTRFSLTPSGEIMFANDELDADQSHRAFGEDGLMPQQTVTDLIDVLIQSISDGHDETDIARLSGLTKSLKSKLEILDTLVLKLAK